MKKPIQIHIPNPCSQNWDEMTPADGGRHCDHCKKTVTDFTTWSDTALYNFFAKNDSPICGRYLSTQLERPIHIPPQPHSRLYRIVVAMGFSLLFTQAPAALAQNKPPRTHFSHSSGLTHKATAVSTGLGSIQGFVKDFDRIPVDNAVLKLYQNDTLKIETKTDFYGCFSLTALAAGRYDVVVSGLGYYTMTEILIIKPNILSQVEFILSGARKIIRNESIITQGEIFRRPETKIEDIIKLNEVKTRNKK